MQLVNVDLNFLKINTAMQNQHADKIFFEQEHYERMRQHFLET